MPESTTNPPPSERDALITEVFLNPIRTLSVVDDEFPTLSDLGKALSAAQENNRTNVDQYMQLCSSQNRGWILDIQNGSFQANQIPDHLTKSDLIVLDYHLEKSESGAKSIKILRAIANSKQFTLVVLHTMEANTSDGLNRVFDDVSIGLSHQVPPDILNDGEQAFANTLRDIEDYDPELPGDLKRLMSKPIVLQVVGDPKVNFRELIRKPALTGLKNRIDQTKRSIDSSDADDATKTSAQRLSEPNAIKWAVFHWMMEHRSEFSEEDYGTFHREMNANGSNWLSLNNLFLTVIPKKQRPDSIIHELSKAVLSWNPYPQRLLLTRMREEIRNIDARLDNKLLENEHLQNAWLKELLNSNNEFGAGSRIFQRYWEVSGDVIGRSIADFPGRISRSYSHISNIHGSSFEGRAINFIDDQALLEMNCFVCSKPPELDHLRIGHVFCANGSLWLILTPSCDLVPSQLDDEYMGWLPFKAIKLVNSAPNTALKEAHRGEHLFLNLSATIETFKFSSTAKGAALPPIWKQFRAQHKGNLEGKTLFCAAEIVHKKDNSLAIESINCEIKGQLRYEYALNLLQKLGASLSRIGLGFVPSNAPENNECDEDPSQREP